MGVREWCEMHRIHPATYYRWERGVVVAASGQLQVQDEGPTSITPATKPVFAELAPVKALDPRRRTENVVATIHGTEPLDSRLHLPSAQETIV